jgi:hypothetical protein
MVRRLKSVGCIVKLTVVSRLYGKKTVFSRLYCEVEAVYMPKHIMSRIHVGHRDARTPHIPILSTLQVDEGGQFHASAVLSTANGFPFFADEVNRMNVYKLLLS